jgi:homocysteine S-methyltransferase
VGSLLQSALAAQPFLVIDGGLSTALEALGHRPHGLLWTAQLVAERPDVVVAAHRLYVEAGADIVISASYQASVEGFVAAGASRAAARRMLASTTELARRSGARWVAASVGPYGAVLGDGSEYHGRYSATWDDVRRFHARRLEVLVDSGPDLVAVETIPSVAEADIVLEELARLRVDNAWLSMSCADEGHTCSGDDIAAAAALANDFHAVDAVGVNCTSPTFVAGLLCRLAEHTAKPLVAYPNHGRLWDAAHECWTGETTTDLAGLAGDWVAHGARLVGGCCGAGPSEIAELAALRHGE